MAEKTDCITSTPFSKQIDLLPEEEFSKGAFSQLNYIAALVESTDDAIVGEMLNGIITSWNKGAEHMFGYKAKGAIGKHISLIIPKELRDEEAVILSKVRQGKYLRHYETMRKKKDGSRLHVSLTVSPIRNNEGKVIGISKIARDITERVKNRENLKYLSRAGEVLASSLDYRTTLLNLTHLAIPYFADWCTIDMLNQDGDIEQVAISHKDPEKVKWATILRGKYPIQKESLTGVPQVIRTGKPEIYPFVSDKLLRHVSKNEREYKLAKKIGFTSVIIVPIKTGRETIGTITFVSAESKKTYTKEDVVIAQEIAKRASSAIEHAKLYTNAQKEIDSRKAIERQKDDLISMTSHELKTPLTSLKVFAQVMEKRVHEQKDADGEKFIKRMNEQINYLIELITEILDVTNAQRGTLTIKREKFLSRDLVTDIVDSLQPITKHQFVIDWHTKLYVYADKERIRQVLINLITNAIKYSPEADKVIVHSEKKDTFIQISVQDFGIGIPKTEQVKIFDRFYQSSSHKTYPGLGLGLYISSEIIKANGGKMWVKSDEGKGSTFYFTLPIYRIKKQKRSA